LSLSITGAIGGCDISKPDYRELLVRWFQYGLTSPIFRQHGARPVEPWDLLNYSASGKEAYVALPLFVHSNAGVNSALFLFSAPTWYCSANGEQLLPTRVVSIPTRIIHTVRRVPLSVAASLP